MSGPAFRKLSITPDLLSIHERAADDWPFLLGSEAGAPGLARWSILLRHDGETLTCPHEQGKAAAFLDQLRALTAASRSPVHGGAQTLPFYSGWFLYLAYELAGQIEPSLELPAAEDLLPVAYAARCPAALLYDHLLEETWLVAESDAWLERVHKELDQQFQKSAPDLSLPSLDVQSDDPKRFLEGVERIKQWIVDGDVFQVNLSRGWTAQSEVGLDPVTVYRALASANPAPFAGLAKLPGGTIVSSSPERLVEVRNGMAQTRPIAGTRPRGANLNEDHDLSAELLANPKERAEHIMLIDLERNDLGRVCVSGSVEVNELMAIESYTHVHHIVSNVRGRVSSDRDAIDVIAAVFPGGTITGCPKVRCMEIIAELEQVGRSFYTGSMGYLGDDGSMDLNILIRSMLVTDHLVSFRTGAGIVADSKSAAELAETQAKARGLLRALAAE
ncbi:MAG: aminodeoxychorismate synthase component I [Wenzhouxiangella sp.]|jgi:anthranilate synthase component 1|nr:aminodeoxychorismate synthase component I [Wenzhouxiangella sp.]